jgi:mono/diheme cytochrome c family protein
MARQGLSAGSRAAIFAVLLAAAGDALAQGTAPNPAEGRRIAERFCISCHVVAPGAAQAATAGIPTFAAMAQNPAQTPERLAGKMIAPHPPMPGISLTRQEMRDLAAYILSLRTP